MKKSILIFGIVFSVTYNFASVDKNVLLKIIPKWENETFELNKTYESESKKNILVSVFKFYLTKIELLNHSKSVYSEKTIGHLLDFDFNGTANILLKKGYRKKFNAIRFNVGVDSITNYQGALGGDLDPIKGMYWTWQSGYINLKMEGFLSKDGVKDNFQYHLGGFTNGYNAVQNKTILVNYEKEIRLNFNVAEFFRLINKLNVKNIMSPSNQSVECMKIVSRCFYYEK